MYVAEQIDHLPRVGQTLTAGDVIARYAKRGTCIETGWSEANGETVAQSTTGYTEGQTTAAGVSFAHFLISLGVQGTFELTPSKPVTTDAKSAGARRRKAKAKAKPTPAPVVSANGAAHL